MSLTYGSVCSGIEAASVAWEPIGMKPLWFSEIEPFPSAVLAAHWPQVDNLGDMTKIAAAIRADDVPAPDLLVGGTPCQTFSIAGLRKGLKDERGKLTLSYIELADSIDEKRKENGEKPAIIVWENVRGVLNHPDNPFGCFISGLAGDDEPFEPGPRPERGKSSQFWTWNKKTSQHVAIWPVSGCVIGPKRTVAWRVLDAQYFGVAQRRCRVFVVASARTDISPAEILFEFESVCGDIAPCGEERKEITGTLTARTHGGGGLGTDFECNGGLIPASLDAENYTGNSDLSREVVAALTKNGVGATGADDNQAQAGHLISVVGTLAAHSFTGGAGGRPEGAAAGHFIPVFGGGNCSGPIDVAACLTAKGQRIDFEVETFAVHGTQDPDVNHELVHTLGRNHGQENACIAIAGNTIGRAPQNGGNGTGYDESGVSYTLTKSDIHGVSVRNRVRRLTPIECERLQGFPDNHTQISWRGKDATDCPDGPRYCAIGNSMAVPVMRWIGERILATLPEEETPDLRSDYVIALEELRNKPAHMLKDVGDQWRSPDALYWGINAKFGPCTLDLFTDGQNSKCPNYYTAEDNALTQDWSEKLKELGGAAYANPPYSRATYHDKQAVTGMVHIMEYAQAMREKGGRYIFLIKAATSETWWPEWADHVAFIRGRIGFDLPDWFVPADEKQKPSGAFFAGAVVILDKDWQGDKISYISRDELIAIGELFMKQAHWLVEKTGEAA
ncbi:phage N-6-adenine-methyltransferase [Morganella morganii]|uniref:phage N-6-adenine-methyltransferase n=1 Tax=Morganella morganii TaxID=582 RepID=UPI0021CE734D|nr:phage N-6-adenine-methyltransferase [Morganella morganii]